MPVDDRSNALFQAEENTAQLRAENAEMREALKAQIRHLENMDRAIRVEQITMAQEIWTIATCDIRAVLAKYPEVKK